MPDLKPGAWVFLDGQHLFAGSLGLGVLDRKSKKLRLLTAAHVIGELCPGRQATDRVYTNLIPGLGPAPLGMSYIGTAGRSAPNEPTLDRTMDAALIEPTQKVTCLRRVGDVQITGEIYEPYDMPTETVYKFGAQSGWTRGEIVAVGADLEFGQPAITYRSGYLIWSTTNTEPFVSPGDSGSVVVTGDGKILGMVVAREHDDENPNKPTAYAFCLPIRSILDALDIELTT